MARPFKKKTVRDKIEAQLAELASQTEELRQQVVDRAPGVRDQIVEQTGALAKQVADRAPVVRDQIVEKLPDRAQLLDLRDDLFEKLPESVQDKLPEQVKPKSSRLKRVAVAGLVTGIGAAAFAAVRRRSSATPPSAPFPEPARPATSGPTSPAAATASPSDIVDTPEPNGVTNPSALNNG
jgi:ElaB/YqjD/DUF883 family membrane-anchored ribosome-binding protein